MSGAGSSVSIYQPDRLLLLSQHAVSEGKTRTRTLEVGLTLEMGDTRVGVTPFLASSLDLKVLGTSIESLGPGLKIIDLPCSLTIF